jgi:15-cis-phytoene synthase
MKELFDNVSMQCSRVTTKAYSTSFSLGILCLARRLRDPIYSIYGFVRFADEIVDSFHNYPKELLLRKFREETYYAIENKISLNPILNSFQHAVHRYQIDEQLIEQFLTSMQMDLERTTYSEGSYKEYILGSAEVVGLMCLKVFCENNQELYRQLKPYAMSLGSAFQKINFLRDIKTDYEVLGRTYFPGITMRAFDERSKSVIEDNILKEFDFAFEGIKKLPRSSRLGVYVAYLYYLALFKKIKNTRSEMILNTRIRIRNRQKAILLAYSIVKHQLNRI